ncbi:MAG: hypothetical protein AAB853_00250, partial [Patescibacteria group bacterium]
MRELKEGSARKDPEAELGKYRLIFVVMNAAWNLPPPSSVKEEKPWKAALEELRFGRQAHEPSMNPASLRDIALAAVSGAKHLDEHFILAALDRAWRHPDARPLQRFWRIILRAQYAAQLFSLLDEDGKDEIIVSVFVQKKHNLPDDFKDVIQSVKTPADALPLLRCPWFCELIACTQMFVNVKDHILEHIHYDAGSQSFSLQKFFADGPYATIPVQDLISFFGEKEVLLEEMDRTEKVFLEDHYARRNAAQGGGQEYSVGDDYAILTSHQDQIAVAALVRRDLASMEDVIDTKTAPQHAATGAVRMGELHALCALDASALAAVKDLFAHTGSLEDLLKLLERFPEHIDFRNDDHPLRPTPLDHGHRILMQQFYRRFI